MVFSNIGRFIFVFQLRFHMHTDSLYSLSLNEIPLRLTPDMSTETENRVPSGLPLNKALHRLMNEMRWNGSLDILEGHKKDACEAIAKLTDEVDANVAAHLLIRKGRIFYPISLIGKYGGCTLQTSKRLCAKGIVYEIYLPNADESTAEDCIDVLTKAELRSILYDIEYKKMNFGNDKVFKAIEAMSKDSAKAALKQQLDFIRQNHRDFHKFRLTFIAVSDLHKYVFQDLCDVYCILTGGKYSHVAHPAASAESPDRLATKQYRSFRVLEQLALAPRLAWKCEPEQKIAQELWADSSGMNLAVLAYHLSWQAYAHFAAPGKRAITPEWLKMSFQHVQYFLKRSVEYPTSHNVEFYMGERCTIAYLAMSALNALAQCAKKVNDYPLCIEMLVLLTQPQKRVHVKHGEAVHNHILCHLHMKQRRRAHQIVQQALCVSYSYLKPFETYSDFFHFHAGKTGQNFIRLADRIAIERTAKSLCKPPLQWNAFHPTNIIEPQTKTLTAVRCDHRKRWRGRDGPCSVEQFVLESYLASLGEGWKGYHCEGGLLSALFFLLCADVRLPSQCDAFVHYLYPSRWREVPIDFGSPHFVSLRKNALAKLFRRLESMSIGEIDVEVKRLYDWFAADRYGTMYTGWEKSDLSIVAQALANKKALVPLLQFILLEGSLSGLPDLWLWAPPTETSPASVRCIEVKAPGDSLSDTQRAWIHVLSSIGVSVEVCHVAAEEKEKKADKK